MRTLLSTFELVDTDTPVMDRPMQLCHTDTTVWFEGELYERRQFSELGFLAAWYLVTPNRQQPHLRRQVVGSERERLERAYQEARL